MLLSDKNLSSEETELINRIRVGCTKIVDHYEKHWLDRNFKFRKYSKKRLALLSLIKHLMLTETKEKFRPTHVKKRLPGDLGKIDSSTLSRILDWSVDANILNRHENTPEQFPIGPGRHRQNDRITNLSGPNSTYSLTEYAVKLKNLVQRPGPRKIIYSHLLESNVIHKFELLSAYDLIITTRDTPIDDLVRMLKIQGPERDYSQHQLILEENQKMLLRANRKEMMEVASEVATILVEKSKDQDYIEFFIDGGLSLTLIIT